MERVADVIDEYRNSIAAATLKVYENNAPNQQCTREEMACIKGLLYGRNDFPSPNLLNVTLTQQPFLSSLTQNNNSCFFNNVDSNTYNNMMELTSVANTGNETERIRCERTLKSIGVIASLINFGATMIHSSCAYTGISVPVHMNTDDSSIQTDPTTLTVYVEKKKFTKNDGGIDVMSVTVPTVETIEEVKRAIIEIHRLDEYESKNVGEDLERILSGFSPDKFNIWLRSFEEGIQNSSNTGTRVSILDVNRAIHKLSLIAVSCNFSPLNQLTDADQINNLILAGQTLYRAQASVTCGKVISKILYCLCFNREETDKNVRREQLSALIKSNGQSKIGLYDPVITTVPIAEVKSTLFFTRLYTFCKIVPMQIYEILESFMVGNHPRLMQSLAGAVAMCGNNPNESYVQFKSCLQNRLAHVNSVANQTGHDVYSSTNLSGPVSGILYDLDTALKDHKMCSDRLLHELDIYCNLISQTVIAQPEESTE